jgi:hypothetical protein
VDGSIVIFAFVSFVIAAQINPMSHLQSPREMIWPTLRAIEISSLARKERHTSGTPPGWQARCSSVDLREAG